MRDSYTISPRISRGRATALEHYFVEMDLELAGLIEELFRLHEERSLIERVRQHSSANLQQELEALLQAVIESIRACVRQILNMREMYFSAGY